MNTIKKQLQDWYLASNRVCSGKQANNLRPPPNPLKTTTTTNQQKISPLAKTTRKAPPFPKGAATFQKPFVHIFFSFATPRKARVAPPQESGKSGNREDNRTV